MKTLLFMSDGDCQGLNSEVSDLIDGLQKLHLLNGDDHESDVLIINRHDNMTLKLFFILCQICCHLINVFECSSKLV